MKEFLSIFFDESGDQGLEGSQAPFYILSMVFHDQSRDIASQIQRFDNHLQMIGQNIHPIHTGPLIRKEAPYQNMRIEERKRLFDSLFNFMRKTEVNYRVVSFEKSVACEKTKTVANVLDEELNNFMSLHENIFHDFNKVIGYYDNGQKFLSTIIDKALNSLPVAVEMRKSSPTAYKLEQVADLVCTLELLDIKSARSLLTQSELEFFWSKRKLQKDYLKQFKKLSSLGMDIANQLE